MLKERTLLLLFIDLKKFFELQIILSIGIVLKFSFSVSNFINLLKYKYIMYHWLTIILGVVILSLSLSNPFYNLMIKKYIKFPFIIQMILRFFLLIIGILIVFLGMYFESKFNSA